MGLTEKVKEIALLTYGVGGLAGAVVAGVLVHNQLPNTDGFDIFAGIVGGGVSYAVIMSPLLIASGISEYIKERKLPKTHGNRSANSAGHPITHRYDADYGGWV